MWFQGPPSYSRFVLLPVPTRDNVWRDAVSVKPASQVMTAHSVSSKRRRYMYPQHARHGPLARYVKYGVAHAPGMLGTLSPPPRVSDPDMHHGTCVTLVPWCMRGSLTSGVLWSRWQGKRSQHSRCMRNAQFYVSGKRPMETSSLVAPEVLPLLTLFVMWCYTWSPYTNVPLYQARSHALY